MSVLEVKNIEKHFGSTQVLKDISFSLEQGQALSIIGASGSGKTTLLRCLNFLEKPDGGTIAVNGKVIFDAADPATQAEKEIRQKRLHFGLVFQSFNLFPQYTALQNITLAPELMAKEKGLSNKAEIEEKARELLASMGLAVPQVSRICRGLAARGLNIDPNCYTIEQAVKQLLTLRTGKGADQNA